MYLQQSKMPIVLCPVTYALLTLQTITVIGNTLERANVIGFHYVAALSLCDPVTCPKMAMSVTHATKIFPQNLYFLQPSLGLERERQTDLRSTAIRNAAILRDVRIY